MIKTSTLTLGRTGSAQEHHHAFFLLFVQSNSHEIGQKMNMTNEQEQDCAMLPLESNRKNNKNNKNIK